MTTTFKDIELLLDSNSIPYNLTTLGWMLKKLDNEDLDVLYSILRHIKLAEWELEQEYHRGYDDGYGEGLYKLEQRCQENYDDGYSEGFDDGLSTEE